MTRLFPQVSITSSEERQGSCYSLAVTSRGPLEEDQLRVRQDAAVFPERPEPLQPRPRRRGWDVFFAVRRFRGERARVFRPDDGGAGTSTGGCASVASSSSCGAAGTGACSSLSTVTCCSTSARGAAGAGGCSSVSTATWDSGSSCGATGTGACSSVRTATC